MSFTEQEIIEDTINFIREQIHEDIDVRDYLKYFKEVDKRLTDESKYSMKFSAFIRFVEEGLIPEFISEHLGKDPMLDFRIFIDICNIPPFTNVSTEELVIYRNSNQEYYEKMFEGSFEDSKKCNLSEFDNDFSVILTQFKIKDDMFIYVFAVSDHENTDEHPRVLN